MNGQLAADWTLDKIWTNPDVAQAWVDSQDWAAHLTTSLAIQKSGFGLQLKFEEDQVTIKDLYYDFETQHADWTLGRKSQEWSFAYDHSQLNWLADPSFVLREQYFGFGQWQVGCLIDEVNNGCLTRLNGSLSATDWQLMLKNDSQWKMGAAVQHSIGQGGLLFLEVFGATEKSVSTLTEIAPDTFQVAPKNEDFGQLNLGMQWSFINSLTVQWEGLLSTADFSESQWQAIAKQLNTPTAGLVADALQSPFGQQHLLRISQKWEEFTFEDIFVYWPQAETSWLNNANISYKIDSRLTAKIEWQRFGEDSLLSDIGQKDKVTVSFSFDDGF
jgi:hypothetical protein